MASLSCRAGDGPDQKEAETSACCCPHTGADLQPVQGTPYCTQSNTCHLADAFIPSLQWVLVFSAWLGSVEIWTLHPDSASLSHWATNNSQLKVSLKAGCQVWNQASASGCHSWQNPCFISHPSVTCEMMIRCDHTEKFEGNRDVINDLSTFICCFHSSSLSARDTQWASQYKDLVA